MVYSLFIILLIICSNDISRVLPIINLREKIVSWKRKYSRVYAASGRCQLCELDGLGKLWKLASCRRCFTSKRRKFVSVQLNICKVVGQNSLDDSDILVIPKSSDSPKVHAIDKEFDPFGDFSCELSTYLIHKSNGTKAAKKTVSRKKLKRNNNPKIKQSSRRNVPRPPWK